MAKYVVYNAGINQKLNKSDGKAARGHVASACSSPICNKHSTKHSRASCQNKTLVTNVNRPYLRH